MAMSGDTRVEIFDEKLNWITRKFSKNYYAQGIVYMAGNKPSIVGSVVKWLDEVQVKTTSQKQADKLMFEYFHKKYPEYYGHVQLF